jgi:hypothetical protein
VTAACKFRATFADLELEDQTAFLRNCVEVLGPTLRLEDADRQVLVRWIEAE